MYQSYDLLATTMIAKIRNIKLKKIILVGFLLFSLLSTTKNIATYNPNNTKLAKTVTEKILGENGFLFGFRGNIIDWIGTSIYNHYTKHNLRKSGLYHGKFFVYGGIKIKITTNVYLDVYYSLLKVIPFWIIDVKIISPNMAQLFLFSFLTFSINIRINKNFYLSISPIHYILYKWIELEIYAYYARRHS